MPEFRDVSPRTRRMGFLRAERVLDFGCCQSQSCTAEWQRREWALGRAGVAVHGGCVSAVLAQLEYTRRGWRGPPLGLLPQNAGQGEDQG